MTPADWTAQPERSSLWALRAMRWLALRAGRRLARLALHPITLYFLLVHHTARRASQRYLGRALRRPARWRDVYRHLHCFAATVLDRVYFLAPRRVQFEVCESGAHGVQQRLELADAANAPAGAMLLGAHLGSFEALRALAEQRHLPLAMLMYADNARLIHATLAALAPRLRLQTIALGRPGSMLALRGWLDGGGLAGLLVDRTLPAHAVPALHAARSRTSTLPFLGHPARFSDAPFRLAALLRRPVFFMVGLYRGGKRYDVRFTLLADFGAPFATASIEVRDAQIAAALRRYVALLESLCREAPFNWFNFFDFWADDDVDGKPAAVAHQPATPR